LPRPAALTCAKTWRLGAQNLASRLEVLAHDDAAFGRRVHLGETGVVEDAALAHAELAPGDVLTGLHDEGIALDGSRAALLRVRRRGRGQRPADTAPSVADPD